MLLVEGSLSLDRIDNQTRPVETYQKRSNMHVEPYGPDLETHIASRSRHENTVFRFPTLISGHAALNRAPELSPLPRLVPMPGVSDHVAHRSEMHASSSMISTRNMAPIVFLL